MNAREFFRAYARSPLGIGSFIVALCAGALTVVAGLPFVVAIAAAAGAFALFLVAGLASGFAQRSAVAESARDAEAAAEEKLAQAAEARRRLASLRLTDPEIAAARDLFVLEAGRLVEDCRRAGTYDPVGVAAVSDSLDIVDAWLREADESSVEKRFGLADEHPFPEAAKRTVEALRAKAALVSARRAAATGEVPGADRIAIEEELK
jgi:hypothetical protein